MTCVTPRRRCRRGCERVSKTIGACWHGMEWNVKSKDSTPSPDASFWGARMGRPMLRNGLQGARGGRSVLSCFVLTMFIETLQNEYTRGGFQTRPLVLTGRKSVRESIHSWVRLLYGNCRGCGNSKSDDFASFTSWIAMRVSSGSSRSVTGEKFTKSWLTIATSRPKKIAGR